MRLLLILIGCCITLTSEGQAIQQALRVQITYEKAGQYLEQAIATIEAINSIDASIIVEYRAGRSITMLPGFEAHAGSTFTANIEPNISKEGDPKLKLIAFPNPFEQSTTIDYYVPADGKVNVWITDTQGKIIGNLVNGENQSAGQHRVEWKPEVASPGVYIPMIQVNQQKATGRVIKK